MNLRWITRLVPLLALLGFAALVRAEPAPDETVKKVSAEVLNIVQTDKELQNGDIAKISKVVDEKIVPIVNLQRMTALAVGPGWREASPAQREQLVAGFKQLLIRTYAGAMSQAEGVKLQFKPTRTEGRDVIVPSLIVQPGGGEPVQVEYRLSQTPEGWKVYDLNVAGAWLILSYRDRFGQEVNKGGVDGLIKWIDGQNAQFASAKK